MGDFIQKDIEMDTDLRKFFNKFRINCEVDDVSLKFKALPLDKQFELIEKYLIYFFKYSIDASITPQYSEGIDNDYRLFVCDERDDTTNGDLYYREADYHINIGDRSCEDDAFHLSVMYNIKDGKPVIRVLHIWISYDLFETGSIGFNLKYTESDNEIREKINKIFQKVYNSIIENDEVHAWLILNGFVDNVKQLLFI